MGKKNIYPLIIVCFVLFLVFPLHAKDIYVTGVTYITMRTGPGTDHKIVSMLKSGTRLEIIEYNQDWTQAKTQDGKSGWVLSRFLTEEIPGALVVDKLRDKNTELMEKLEEVSQENTRLVNENKSLTEIKEKYNKLKQESADFLKLDKEHKQITQLYEAQKKQIVELESGLNNEKKLWFLSGAGVLIVGLFLGLSMRKKKRSSLL